MGVSSTTPALAKAMGMTMNSVTNNHSGFAAALEPDAHHQSVPMTRGQKCAATRRKNLAKQAALADARRKVELCHALANLRMHLGMDDTPEKPRRNALRRMPVVDLAAYRGARA